MLETELRQALELIVGTYGEERAEAIRQAEVLLNRLKGRGEVEVYLIRVELPSGEYRDVGSIHSGPYGNHEMASQTRTLLKELDYATEGKYVVVSVFVSIPKLEKMREKREADSDHVFYLEDFQMGEEEFLSSDQIPGKFSFKNLTKELFGFQNAKEGQDD
jgi:hypothetical protein